MRKVGCLSLLMVVALAAAPPGASEYHSPPSYELLGEISNDPAWTWLVWWTGVGNVADFTIANFLQTGFIERPFLYKDVFYTGEPVGVTSDNVGTGKVAEYPAGSQQYYSYSCGFWFGALYPSGPDTWSPAITRTGPYPDMGAMSVPEMEDGGGMGDISSTGLFLADMHIAEGYEGEGDFLFVYPGQTQKSYQVLWPFADVTLNDNRPPDDQLDPSEGDMVSHQDTYAVGGDWIPMEDAVTFWLPHDTLGGKYFGTGLDVRFEQRTYSWSRGDLANVIVLNYKIRNMSDHELQALYVAFFMDNDIGTGGSEPGDQGFWDDLVGYNSAREVCYTYDSDGSETGWNPPPGYIGAVFLETPSNVGATGLESWEHDTLSAMDSLYLPYYSDSIRYVHMQTTDFNTLDTPTDVRMLLLSGPYPDMQPDDEYDYTMAIVLGDDLNDFLSNVDAVKAAFDQGFPWVGIEEPEPPAPSKPIKLSLTTANVSNDLIGLRYSLPRASNIDISVFDAVGRKVQTLKQGYTPAGSDEITWYASDTPAGVYFVKFSVSGESCTERVLIVR